MSAHNIYGFNGTEAACTCSPRIWRPSADFMAHAARAAERALVEQVKAVLAGVPHSDGCYVPLRRACDCWQADLRSALRPEAATTEGAADDQTCCAMAEVVCARCSNCPVHCLCRQPCTKCPPGEHSDLRHGGLVDPLAARPDTGEGAE